jgi:hypothetical protein
MPKELTYNATTIEQFYTLARNAKEREVVDAIHLETGMLASSDEDGKYALATTIQMV